MLLLPKIYWWKFIIGWWKLSIGCWTFSMLTKCWPSIGSPANSTQHLHTHPPDILHSKSPNSLPNHVAQARWGFSRLYGTQ
ncbi:hypothetical protein BDV59DRAFT_186350 [Aspergillus ambiguus]|uniref:uncharacterized protein n=1 Tax=Aspergillus ambiguus TaxID=176160 RepID=UPI003CCE4A20